MPDDSPTIPPAPRHTHESTIATRDEAAATAEGIAKLERKLDGFLDEVRNNRRFWRMAVGGTLDFARFVIPIVVKPWVWIPAMLAIIALGAGAAGVGYATDLIGPLLPGVSVPEATVPRDEDQ